MPLPRPKDGLESVRIEDVMIPMCDGTRLWACVEFPAENGTADFNKKYPVMLVHSAYCTIRGWDRFQGMCEYALAIGYVYMTVAARGTFKSEGQLQPLANEGWGQDGCPDRGGWGVNHDCLDMVHWVLKQPWCNGQIATNGMSWQGGSQLLPWVADNEYGPETSIIVAPAVNAGYGCWGYDDGFFTLDQQLGWVLNMIREQVENGRYSPRIAEAIRKDNESLGSPLPDMVYQGDCAKWSEKYLAKYGLMDFPIAKYVPFWRKWVENRDNLDFFSYNDTAGRKHAFNKPLLFMSGYYDPFLRNAIWAYERAVKDAPTKEIAEGHRLILNPFNHASSAMEYLDERMNIDYANLFMDWTNRQVKGIPAEMFDEGKVFIFVIGENKWRAEPCWPIQGAVPTEYYLHSGGNANTLDGDGVLSTERPAAESTDHYKADPSDPVPSIYDNILFTAGYGDNSEIEKRKDVLVYTSPVLEEDTEVTGWINATLYAATSGTDTDFLMRLEDVHPDGKAMQLCFGGVRGRYRKDRRNPEPMIPGQIEKLDIPMRVTSCVFKKGHRIRVEVISAMAYLYDINPNCFIDLNTCTEKDYVVADQTIYHDAEHPSSITLPIIPADRERKWIDFPYEVEKTGGIKEKDYMPPYEMNVTLVDPKDLPTVDTI